MITPKEIISKYTIEELNKTADEYFLNIDVDRLLQKPFHSIVETSEVVLTFCNVVKGLNLQNGATILDFGCGSGWTSRALTNYGYNVILTDVSQAALNIAEKLYRFHPPLYTNNNSPKYLLFNGHIIDLPDESVDGISCVAAFHHLSNPHEVLHEFYRILKPWGRVCFHEPGPMHSTTAQSQEEMLNHAVLENDIIIEDLWGKAKSIGFTDIQLCIYQPEPCFVPLEDFDSFIKGAPNDKFNHITRLLMKERRLFILEKGRPDINTSALALGLNGTISMSSFQKSKDKLIISLSATNIGTSLWRNSDDGNGPVRFGVFGFDTNNNRVEISRLSMPKKNRYGTLPGESFTIQSEIIIDGFANLKSINIQLVAEWVSWFGNIITINL